MPVHTSWKKPYDTGKYGLCADWVDPCSSGTVTGFILSLLGTILLFIGGLISFASKHARSPTSEYASLELLTLVVVPRSIVLFSIGIIISLIGTGFLMYVGSDRITCFEIQD